MAILSDKTSPPSSGWSENYERLDIDLVILSLYKH